MVPPPSIDLSGAEDGDSRPAPYSILFSRPEDRVSASAASEPTYFGDLNLDQVIEAMTNNHGEYDLRPFFYARLGDCDAVHYRHEVLQDLEQPVVLDSIRAFTRAMRSVRGKLKRASNTPYEIERQGWLVGAVDEYTVGVTSLARGLASAEVRSRGLRAFTTYLNGYLSSTAFASLIKESEALGAELQQVRYCLLIRGGKVTVRNYESQPDYSAEVLEVFERFKQDAPQDYRVGFSDHLDMDHVEAQIVDRVARLFPDVFASLKSFCDRHAEFFDTQIREFDREVHFYVACLEYIANMHSSGLQFCYPEVSSTSKAIAARDTFDLGLAAKLVSQGNTVICNDFHLDGPERVLVISGPNQGGKTTLARTFGQLHHLAAIGCPVPGSSARLFLFDQMFTHFGSEEELANLSGKLEEDLVRLRGALRAATHRSIIIMNEIFASTTLQDALTLGTRVLNTITDLDLLGVYVTFVDELASLNESTVSMVSTIVPGNPTLRTYKVVRKPADGLAYAAAIAEKYGLTYERLKERIVP
ncbi:MAG: MutS-related protein [Acidimicrobiales bacterium]